LPIGLYEIRRLCKKVPPLIENITEEQFKEGHAGVDLRLGSISTLDSRSKAILGLGSEDRKIPIPNEMISYEKSPLGTAYTIRPGTYVVAGTIERLNMPRNMIAFFWPRATLHTSGVIMNSSPIHPKYQGGLLFGLYNAGSCEFEIRLGARFVHIAFFKVQGKTQPYIQGDKVFRIKTGRQ